METKVRMSISVSELTKSLLKRCKGNKGWDEFFNELINAMNIVESLRKEKELTIESRGDPDCEHELYKKIESSAESYFIVWRCRKCDLEAYEFLGIREYGFEDVLELVGGGSGCG